MLIDIPQTIKIKDIFGIYYPPENWLSIIELTGQEIKNMMEFFFTGWFAIMSTANSYLLDYKLDDNGSLITNSLIGGYSLKKLFLFCYNAAEIDFTVNLKIHLAHEFLFLV